MARRLSGTTDQVTVNQTGIIPAAWPLTLAITVNKLADEVSRILINVGNSGSDTNWIAINNNAESKYQIVTYSTSLSQLAAPTVSGNGRHALVGRWISNTNRELFIDGASVVGGSGQTSIGPPSSMSRLSVGQGIRVSFIASATNHEVGEAAVWSVALSNEQILAYSRGVPASQIRPDALKLYWPLYGHSPEPDLSGNGLNSTTIVGTSIVGHVPVARYAPAPRYWPSAAIQIDAPATENFSPYHTVIDGNPAGWDAFFENVSCVVKFNDTYFLYYIGGDADADEGDDWVYNRQVGVATSPDMVNWTKYGSNPILSFTPEGDQPEEGIGDCKCVVYDGKVHMYYSALRWRSGGVVDVEIRYRVSTDGFTFTDDVLIIDDTDEELYASGVYVTPGGTFHLWYAGPLTGGVGDLKKLSGSDPASLSSDGTITTNDYSSRGGIVPLDADNLLFFNDRFFDGSITCTLIETSALGALGTVFPAIDFNGGGAALDVPGCFFYEDGQWFQFSIKSSSATAPFDTTQIVMRTSPELPAFEMAPSSNIAASAATATTAIMSAPGGKTTGDFDAGTISDDTNPLPSINLTEDAYTELEWCLQGTIYAGPDVVYEFRVSDDGAALDTYTDLPEWTIEAEAEAYELSVDPAAVAITTDPVTILGHRLTSVDPASVAVTPVDVGLLRRARMAVDPAAVVVTPVNPSLLARRQLILDPASVAVNPVDVTLEASAAPSAYSLSLDPAAVSVTPVDVSALSHRVVSLDPASALISPVDPSLLKHVAMRVDPVSVSITPADPSLLAHYGLVPDPATVQITPTDVTLNYSEAANAYSLILDPASVAVTTVNQAIRKHSVLSVEPVAVGIQTVDVSLTRGYQLSIAPSVVSVSTVGVMVRGAFLIPCDPVAVTMTPRDMSLAWSGAPVYGNVLRLSDARLWVPGVTGEALGIPQQAQEALRLPGITNESLIES